MPEENQQPVSPYHLFMLFLCIYVLVLLGVEVIVPLDDDTRQILGFADFVICLLFLGDFLRNLWRAENKWAYFFTWGWIDLLSSIPNLDAARWGRAARVFRILRLLRGLRSTRLLASAVLRRRAESAFLTALLLSVLVLTFSSIAVLHFERDAAGANLRQPGDAMWWAFVTMTTVGYGDHFPITEGGRIVAVGLMVAGVGLFGTFTGLVASWFIDTNPDEMESELTQLRNEVEHLRSLLVQLVPSEQGNTSSEKSEPES